MFYTNVLDSFASYRIVAAEERTPAFLFVVGL